MQESHTILVGNLTADPTLKEVPSGAQVCNFRIGVTPRWRDRESGQWREGASMFIGVDCWRALAENANETLRKGDRVVVVGRLRHRAWVTAEGQERTSVEVDAEAIGPDLNRHVATLRKANRNGSAPAGAGAHSAAPDGPSEDDAEGSAPEDTDNAGHGERAGDEPAALQLDPFQGFSV